MPRKVRQVRADLRKNGFRKIRQAGSHETWAHPLVPTITVTLAGPDGADVKSYQETELQQALGALKIAQQQQKGGQP